MRIHKSRGPNASFLGEIIQGSVPLSFGIRLVSLLSRATAKQDTARGRVLGRE